MHIIPVIDLLNGVVVHAKNGLRQHYQPIQSQLCASCQALDIVKALLEYYPFTQLYIADLNAIQKSNSSYTSNLALIKAIQQQFPQLTLWLDAGICNYTELSIWRTIKAKIVLGSENFAAIGNYISLRQSVESAVLSLDFFLDGYHGPAELLTQQEYWPQDVILMSLGNVGANKGVNAALLHETLARANGVNLYAAGGVRNIADLTQLQSMQIKGVLVATAIHQRQISPQDIFETTQTI